MKILWLLKWNITSFDGRIHDRNTINTITIGITIRIGARQYNVFIIVKFYISTFGREFSVSEIKIQYWPKISGFSWLHTWKTDWTEVVCWLFVVDLHMFRSQIFLCISNLVENLFSIVSDHTFCQPIIELFDRDEKNCPPNTKKLCWLVQVCNQIIGMWHILCATSVCVTNITRFWFGFLKNIPYVTYV